MRSRKTLSRFALLGVMALVAVMLMAVPGNATFAKKYDLSVTPSSIPAGGSLTFTAKYTNKSLYKIGSTELSVPGGFQVTAVGTPTKGTLDSGQTDPIVKIKNLNLSLGSSFTVTVTATAPCGGTPPFTWTAKTWTSNYGGSLFQPPSGNRTTSVEGTCNATIDVTKYEDSDVSGERGGGEPTLDGWVFTAHEGSTPDGAVIGLPQTTGEDGTATFSLPIGGTYTICETPQDGWTNTDPGGSACETVEGLTGDGASLLFGNAEGAGELACPSTPGEENDTDNTGGDGDPFAALARDENADGSECELVPYILRSSTEGETEVVEFIKDLDDQVSAQFVLDITWLPEDANNPLGRLTQVDYGDGPVDLNWCDPSPGGVQLYDLPDPTSGNPNLWCLVEQHAVGGQIAGKVTVTEKLYGLGDPRVTRG